MHQLCEMAESNDMFLMCSFDLLVDEFVMSNIIYPTLSILTRLKTLLILLINIFLDKQTVVLFNVSKLKTEINKPAQFTQNLQKICF